MVYVMPKIFIVDNDKLNWTAMWVT